MTIHVAVNGHPEAERSGSGCGVEAGRWTEAVEEVSVSSRAFGVGYIDIYKIYIYIYLYVDNYICLCI